MGDIDNVELLYVAGIGVFVNLLLFATTLLISACKNSHAQNTTDIEAFHEQVYNDINVGLLLEDDDLRKNVSLKIIDLIPSMEFCQIGIDIEGGCSICLRDGFETHEICKVLPNCDHVFHSECIDEWLRIRHSCPVCRQDFSTLLS